MQGKARRSVSPKTSAGTFSVAGGRWEGGNKPSPDRRAEINTSRAVAAGAPSPDDKPWTDRRSEAALQRELRARTAAAASPSQNISQLQDRGRETWMQNPDSYGTEGSARAPWGDAFRPHSRDPMASSDFARTHAVRKYKRTFHQYRLWTNEGKTPSFEPCDTTNDDLTKTGSGQTYEKHSKHDGVLCRRAGTCLWLRYLGRCRRRVAAAGR